MLRVIEFVRQPRFWRLGNVLGDNIEVYLGTHIAIIDTRTGAYEETAHTKWCTIKVPVGVKMQAPTSFGQFGGGLMSPTAPTMPQNPTPEPTPPVSPTASTTPINAMPSPDHMVQAMRAPHAPTVMPRFLDSVHMVQTTSAMPTVRRWVHTTSYM